jgi:hypothetical protein
MEELNDLHLNQRVSMSYVTNQMQIKSKFGYLVKIYKNEGKVKVWFDGDSNPQIVCNTKITIIND